MLKDKSAKKAVEMIRDGDVIGLGSGSTVKIFIEELGKRIKSEEIEVFGIPTSFDTHILAVENGIKISDLFQHPEPDICIDGADQVDRKMNLIKGGGGALTREKVVAYASKKFVVIVDENKLVESLSMPVPIEVLPFAFGYVSKKLEKKGYKCNLRIGSGKLRPIISDNGNFIADVYCNLDDLERVINDLKIPGVIENGIFLSEIVDAVIVGKRDGVDIIKGKGNK